MSQIGVLARVGCCWLLGNRDMTFLLASCLPWTSISCLKELQFSAFLQKKKWPANDGKILKKSFNSQRDDTNKKVTSVFFPPSYHLQTNAFVVIIFLMYNITLFSAWDASGNIFQKDKLVCWKLFQIRLRFLCVIQIVVELWHHLHFLLIIHFVLISF